jgi:thioredoxin 1
VASNVVPLNDATFDTWTENVIELTVVCVGAKWCKNTADLAPLLEDLGAEYARRVRFAMVDFDESPDFVRAHNVTAVPTMLLFKRNAVCGDVIIACGIEARGAVEEAIRRFV